MRLIFIPIALAALLLGLAIGLVSRGERVEDLPQRAVDVVRTQPDSSAASTSNPKSPGVTSIHRPATYSKGAVKVAGLMSHRALTREGENGEELAFFGTFEKTRVALELNLDQVPQALGVHIVGLQREDSTLSRFTDDLGTDLMLQSDASDLYEMMPRISADGLGLLAVVASKVSPSPSATRVIVEGELSLLCASEKITQTSKPTDLTPGTTLSVGSLQFEVSSTGPSDWDASKWNLELKTDDAIDSIVSWSLVDDSGEVLPLESSMTWTMNSTTQKTLVAPKTLEHASLQLEMWADPKTITVPYSVSAGVGLQ